MSSILPRANTVLDNSLNCDPEFGKTIELPDSLLPVEEFDYHLLPDGPFADHVKDISERMQCPPDYVAIAIMVVLGAVIGRSHQIQPKEYDDWNVVPNLWGLIIGNPSQLKTPAVESILSLLKQIDTEARERFEAELKTFECDQEFIKVERESIRAQAKKLLNENKCDEARALFEDQNEIEGPVRRSYFTNDSTTEKLGELLAENPNGLLVFRDELHGFLRTIDNEQRPNDRAFYLEGFNGTGSYRYDRIKRGTIDIQNHVISLLGTIQPGRLASYIHQAIRQGSGDDGLAQRFQLAVYPDEAPTWRNVDRPPNNVARDAVYDVIKALVRLAEADEPVMLRFSLAAQKIFNEWRDDLENIKLRNNDEHPALVAHLAKFRSLLPSLALIIHLVDTCNSEITDVSKTAITKACAWCDYLESHARRIYADATHNSIKAAKLILVKIENGKLSSGFTAREIHRKGWTGLNDNTEIKEGLEVLVDYGFLRECLIETLGRSSITYGINPCVSGAEYHG